MPDSECVFAVVLTRGDVRHIAQDWNLSDDELKPSCSGWTMLLYMAHVTELFPILSMN
ncbi:putative DNA methylase [Escherichia coli]|uniref:Putative DNA methylase n=1 Tax=Escherichia coli TaxID=562 RepID=A0A377CXH5_ECOLX|nr:putative DNA methylase [Escherichia coli]